MSLHIRSPVNILVMYEWKLKKLQIHACTQGQA
jgi:hypothetical protein